MKSISHSIGLAALLTLANVAVRAEHVTLTVSGSGPITNTVAELNVAEYRVAEIVSFPTSGQSINWPRVEIVKDGLTIEYNRYDFPSGGTQPFERIAVAGPAVIRLRAVNQGQGLCTIKLTPESFPPDKTVIVLPGEHGANVNLESSTDLVNWSVATNGVYVGLTEARFFRIHLDRVP